MGGSLGRVWGGRPGPVALGVGRNSGVGRDSWSVSSGGTATASGARKAWPTLYSGEGVATGIGVLIGCGCSASLRVEGVEGMGDDWAPAYRYSKKQSNDPGNNQHILNTPIIGHR